MDDPERSVPVYWRGKISRSRGASVLSAPPFWAQRYILILGNSRETRAITTASVTVKICIIDEAASEAIAAWECVDNKPIDETNYESRATMPCTLIGQVEGTNFRMLHGGPW
jgi:hypothetical protein